MRSQFALNNLCLYTETVLIWHPSPFGQKTHERNRPKNGCHGSPRLASPIGSCSMSQLGFGTECWLDAYNKLGDNFYAAKSQIIY